MLIEGYYSFESSISYETLSEFDHLSKTICGEKFIIGTSELNSDPYEKTLIASFNYFRKESISLSNFLHREIDSFSVFLEVLKSLDNKLRLGIFIDQKSSRLFLSRELFGTVPFYYLYIPGQFCALSTRLSSLVRKRFSKGHLKINTETIINFHGFSFDPASKQGGNTFYSEIKTVPPGHIIEISDKGISTLLFANFSLNKYAHLSSISDYGEVARTLFFGSVKSAAGGNLKSPVASHLSGGLDSSSVSATFRAVFPDRTLHTLYHKNDSLEMDESIYARSISSKIASIHHELYQPMNDFELIRRHTAQYGEPEASFLSPAHLTSMLPFAKSENCDIILRGSGGDSVIGGGMEVLQESFDARDWESLRNFLQLRVKYFAFADQYPNWSCYTFEKKYQLVLQNFLYQRFAKVRHHSIIEIYEWLSNVDKNLGISYSYFLKRAGHNFFKRLTKVSVNSGENILREDIARYAQEDKNIIALSFALRGSLSSAYQPSFNDIFTPMTINLAEQQFVLGEYYGIRSRSPFLDKDLLELCLAVPNAIKFGSGKGREHMREAMKGLISTEVYNRSTKATLASSHGQETTERLYNQAREFLNDTVDVWTYIDKKKFANQVDVLKNPKIPHVEKVRSWFHITKTISLACWLDWLKSIK